MKIMRPGILTLFILAVFIATAFASMEQLKTYRKVYKEFKPKCFYCHTDEKPKKADGKHDLNAYGLKLQEMMNGEKLTEEMIESIGNHEDFVAEEVEGSKMVDEVSQGEENQQEVDAAVENLQDAVVSDEEIEKE